MLKVEDRITYQGKKGTIIEIDDSDEDELLYFIQFDDGSCCAAGEEDL